MDGPIVVTTPFYEPCHLGSNLGVPIFCEAEYIRILSPQRKNQFSTNCCICSMFSCRLSPGLFPCLPTCLPFMEKSLNVLSLYSIIRLYRTRLYRNSAYIEVQSAVPPDTMSIQKMIGYIETRIYRSIHHGPLNFDITGLYCTQLSFNFNNLSLHQILHQYEY